MLQRRNWLDDVTGYGKVTIEPLEWLPLEFLCFNMRSIDAEEIYDNLPSDNPLELAAMLHHGVAKNGCGWIARLNGRPAGCIGVTESHPGCWQLFSFGTTDYRRVAVFFKSKLDKMVGFGRERGMHRLECRSLLSHVEAHRYIGLLELKLEATLHKYGRKGQDYLLFARTW